jgi:hypothetical protein
VDRGLQGRLLKLCERRRTRAAPRRVEDHDPRVPLPLRVPHSGALDLQHPGEVLRPAQLHEPAGGGGALHRLRRLPSIAGSRAAEAVVVVVVAAAAEARPYSEPESEEVGSGSRCRGRATWTLDSEMGDGVSIGGSG